MFRLTRCRFFLPLLIAAFSTAVQAQAPRCELHLGSCLDYAGLGSIDITVPANTTRIAREPLSVCMSGSLVKKAVDFVFAVDMSRSMYGLPTYSNDPLFLTPRAVQTALNYLETQLGNLTASSNVGFMGFSNGICDGSPSVPCVNTDNQVRGAGNLCTTHQSTLVKPAPFPSVKNAILSQAGYTADNYHFECGRLGTNTEYNDALELAGNWLDSLGSPNKQVIIFLTDGSANEGDFIQAVSQFVTDHDSTNFPVVYALFLNPPDPLAAPYAYHNLQTLVDKTLGTFYRLDSAEQIADIMLEIIQQNIAADPTQTTVANGSNSRTGSASVHTLLTQGEYGVTLDKVVALDSGVINPVTFSSSASNSAGQSRAVNISVTGPAVSVSDPLPDVAPFVLECYSPTAIEFYTADFARAIPGGLDFTENSFGMTLNSPSEIPPGQSITLTGGAVGTVPLDAAWRGIGTSGKISGTLISAEWTHPDDPRDNALGTLPVIDTLPSQVFFTDMAGNVITEITDSQRQFKVVVTDELITGPQTITLTSDDGDREALPLTEAGPNRYEAVVDFRFIAFALPENLIIEGALDTLADINTTLVTASLNSASSGTITLRADHAPISHVYIVDGDGDGRADTVFIRFVNPKTSLPADSVTSIDWPAEGGNNFSAAARSEPALSEIGFYIKPDGTADMSLLAIVLKDPGEQFEEGVTSPDPLAPPSLVYKGAEWAIADSARPVILSAEKAPSGFERYLDAASDSIMYKPDTLYITLSEAITADWSLGIIPWTGLLNFDSEGQVSAVRMQRAPVEIDSLNWKIVLNNSSGVLNPMTGDGISLNPDALFADRSGNAPGVRYVEITGRDGSNRINAAEFMVPVSGIAVLNTGSLTFRTEDVPVLDDRGNVIETRRVDNKIGTIDWVPPVQLNAQGVIDRSIPCSTDPAGADQTPSQTFPGGCLAALVILSEPSDGPYSSHVEIYDHLGQYIQTLEQDFGRCGEYLNQDRMAPSGRFINPVIWNQRDREGKLVGNGVYIWIVRMQFDSGRTKGHVKKMGVVRNIKLSSPECTGN